MAKKTPDYDNVFKTMKSKHKRLFISVINDIFNRNYPLDTPVETLPTEGYLSDAETDKGEKKIEEQIADFLIKIKDEVYLLECQSYDDGSMAIRLAEYAFIAARQFATWSIGKATVPMPRYSVIYIKKTPQTPEETVITFVFPDGQKVDYSSPNVILEHLTKEEIIEKRLFPYIPFYIARYEDEISKESDILHAVKDMEYFRDEMTKLHRNGELSDDEIVDLMGFVNTIITHITDGNKSEERLVNVMGGVVIETESEKIRKKERKAAIERMIRANFSREQILSCGYTDDELEEVEKRLFVNN
ncbi:MAG: hypothetical protein IJ727_11485 [Treponema sp.]|nr:hypothetical protein [Treponema sp.]